MLGKYDESFQKLSHKERQKRFGQFDHVRRFDFSIQDLNNANVPENLWRGFYPGTILKLKRNDMVFIH